MRRVGVLFLFMLILILTAAPIDVAAADGDVSSESIGEDYSHKFRETLPDDTLHFPDLDAYWNTTDDNADAYADYDGGGTPTREGTIADTYSNDTNNQYLFSMGSTSNYIYMRYNLTFSNINAFDDYHLKTHALWDSSDSGSFDARLRIYNFTAGSWGNLFSYTGTTTQDHHRDDALSETNHIDPTVVTATIWVSFECRRDILFQGPFIRVYYVANTFEADTISGYSESFCNVSDITVGVGETVTTDGDLGTFHHPGDNAWDYYFWNAPSALVVQVIEWRCHANISSSSYEFALYSADDGGGSQLWTSGSITAPTSAETKKYSPMVTGVESIRLATRHASSPAAFIFDYLRGSLSTEMGWSHSGSTTAGIDDDGIACTTYSYSSDGDIVTLNATKIDTVVDNPDIYFRFDMTTTAADVERDYYQFLKFEVVDIRISGTMSLTYGFYGDGYKVTPQPLEIGVTCINILSTTAATSNHWMLWISGAECWTSGESFEVDIDFVKAYSIANFTVTQSGVTTDDVLHTDSGVLYSTIDDGYIELNHDPALSVSDTYSVYNLTTSGTAPEFSQYVSEWSAYSDETRGATTSGTVTDIKLKFNSTEIISAIKFIEDGTAPAVVRSSSTPNDPEDDEAVTLSAVITDTIEVYSVAFNAIVYPTGFSDVDYSANEQADNLWNYTFSSLDAGYYCFKIIASDGANTNALTEYAYIELTVREAAIRVEEITLIGAGSDFEMMTFSARINRDCSFTIYEESASSPESDTHTGSVTAPSFNLAWTKLDVDDANVNFTIRFTSGSLTYNYTSQYQVAQTTFYVSTVTQTVSLDTVTVTGRITKLGAYQVYDGSDVLKDYGSIADLDFKVQFTRWGGYDEQNHDFAIKFTNGTQTCWYNSSFYAFKKPVVAPFPIEDKNALYAFQVSFWTGVGVAAILGLILVDLYRRYWK